MARPSSPPSSAAAASSRVVFRNTGKLFQPFHQMGIGIGNDSHVYDCNGVRITVTELGRPAFISIDPATTPAAGETRAETRNYSVTNFVIQMNEDLMDAVGEPLTPEEGEELCAEVLSRIESTKLEIRNEFSTDGSSTISDDDVNFFLRSEILAQHKDQMIPLIRDALRKNRELIESELENNPSTTPYEATLHIPELTFREAVTQLRSIDDEQLFAILNLGFDYERVMRAKPYFIEIQHLKEIRKNNPTANLIAIYEELSSLPHHKLFATCLGFSPEFIATVEDNKYRHLDYLDSLKQELLEKGKPLKTQAEMLDILEQTAGLTDKNQFRGLLLGLSVELAGRLSGYELEDSFHLEYLTNEVVGNLKYRIKVVDGKRIELSDAEKAVKVGEIFTSIEGCENYPQCIAKRELGFSDDIIHSNYDAESRLIRSSDLESVNFVVNLKAKKPTLTVDELVKAYNKIIKCDAFQFKAASIGLPLEIAETITFDRGEISYLQELKRKNPLISEEELAVTYQKLRTFSNFQFRAAMLGLPLETAEGYFAHESLQTDVWLQYLQNFKEKNPEAADEQTTAKFNEILPLIGELQLRALGIGITPSCAKKFALNTKLMEKKIELLEDLKYAKPDITDEEINPLANKIADMNESLFENYFWQLFEDPAPTTAAVGAEVVGGRSPSTSSDGRSSSSSR
jgi:hypothetical protein